jgi:large subunit ribosomal protein L10
MPTAEKIATVESLTAMLKQSTGVYLADFTGLDVPTFTQLRKQLRDEDVSFLVVKNRLAKLAVKEAGVNGLDGMLVGPTGLVCCESDPVAPARILTKFAGVSGGKPVIKAGYIAGNVYVDAQLEALAKLPSREVLLAQMVTAMQSPITGLVYTLNGIIQKLVRTLQAVADKKQEEGQQDSL